MNRSVRRGVTAVETAMVIPHILILFLATFDLGLMNFRQHALDHAAAHAARLASVHGANASATGPWGPVSIDEPITSIAVPIVAQTAPYLTSCNPSETRILVEWPDGDNRADSEVRVQITTVHGHLISAILGIEDTLRAKRAMLIQH